MVTNGVVEAHHITVKGKNFVETLISEAHEEILHGEIERTTKALADKYWI